MWNVITVNYLFNGACSSISPLQTRSWASPPLVSSPSLWNTVKTQSETGHSSSQICNRKTNRHFKDLLGPRPGFEQTHITVTCVLYSRDSRHALHEQVQLQTDGNIHGHSGLLQYKHLSIKYSWCVTSRETWMSKYSNLKCRNHVNIHDNTAKNDFLT